MRDLTRVERSDYINDNTALTFNRHSDPDLSGEESRNWGNDRDRCSVLRDASADASV